MRDMLTETQQLFIDEMTNEERSVFLYHYILKMSQKNVAKHLSLSIKHVRLLIKCFDARINFLPTLDELLEAFELE